MDFKEIQDLMKLVSKLELTELKVQDGNFSLSIRSKNYEGGKLRNIAPQAMMPMQAPAPIAQPQHQPDLKTAASEKKGSASGGDSSKGEDETSGLIEVKSPIVGTFYRSPSPDKPPYIKVGDSIEVGSVVCIVEAMKLFNEIESEVSGKVVKVVI